MQPILYTIKSFDATTDMIFRFVWEGNQSFGNICVIRDNITNSIVYSQSETTMRLEHNLQANTLVNGTWYNAVIASVDVDGNVSDYSNPIVFCCLSTPILKFTNITNNAVLKNSVYKITMSYSQAENEILESYEISLYDDAQTLIQTSGVVYTADTILDYTLTNLEDNQTYYIRGTCYTVNGMNGSTDFIPISVNYQQPSYYSIITLENVAENGYIKIQSNIRAVDCKVNGTPIFIDGEYIDLRYTSLTINEDYVLDSDYIITFSGYNFLQGLIMEIGSNVKIYYTTEGNETYLELYCPFQNTIYYCQSNRLTNVTSSTKLEVYIIRKNGIFEMKINRK